MMMFPSVSTMWESSPDRNSEMTRNGGLNGSFLGVLIGGLLLWLF